MQSSQSQSQMRVYLGVQLLSRTTLFLLFLTNCGFIFHLFSYSPSQIHSNDSLYWLNFYNAHISPAYLYKLILMLPKLKTSVQFSSVAQSCPTLCNSMNRSTPGLPVHHQLPEFTQTQCPSSLWCHPAISSSVVPFSSCPQSLPASESFPMSQLFAWGGQSTGVSALASFPPKNPQDWYSSEWTDWISLQSKGLSRVFSNTTVQEHQFFGAQPSSYFLPNIITVRMTITEATHKPSSPYIAATIIILLEMHCWGCWARGWCECGFEELSLAHMSVKKRKSCKWGDQQEATEPLRCSRERMSVWREGPGVEPLMCQEWGQRCGLPVGNQESAQEASASSCIKVHSDIFSVLLNPWDVYSTVR